MLIVGKEHMIEVEVSQAVSGMQRLLEQVESGEEAILQRNGKSVVRLLPVVQGPTVRRQFGVDARLVVLHDSFDAPLEEFEG